MRRLITILLLASFVLFISYWLYSKTETWPYTEATARKDMANGQAKLFSFGLSVLGRITIEQRDTLQRKYGFEAASLGCTVNRSIEKKIEKYNSIVEEYLIKRNGPHWRENYSNDLDRMLDIKSISAMK
ncbi:MAG TPA: hypothetical protein VGQ04_19125 [Chitinophagaceae bacterium]|jgi:hypothetical protein|nr:hypothetical protein [Chitinophagaceae bacterium]